VHVAGPATAAGAAAAGAPAAAAPAQPARMEPAPAPAQQQAGLGQDRASPSTDRVEVLLDDDEGGGAGGGGGGKKKPVKASTVTTWLRDYGWAVWDELRTAAGHPIIKCSACSEFSCCEAGKGKLSGKWHEQGAVCTTANELKVHANQAGHKLACEHRARAAGIASQEGPQKGIISSITRMKKAAAERVSGVAPLLIYTALFIIFHNLPASIFPAQLAHCVFMQAYQGYACLLGNQKYSHTRYFWSCLFACSQVLFASQIKAIAASPCWGLMIDSSSDISGEDHLLVYARFQKTPEGWEFTTQFLCAVKMSAGTSSHITAVVLKVIALTGLPLDKLVGVCTDGATSMLGCHNGFVTQLAARVPWVISIHCIAHRCALVLSTKVKHFSELRKVDSLLAQVHSLFAHSMGKPCKMYEIHCHPSA
jgi:hypothetical protein